MGEETKRFCDSLLESVRQMKAGEVARMTTVTVFPPACKPDPEMIDDENPEWTEEDFKKAVPFSELTKELQEKLRSIHNRQKKTVKTSIL